MTVKIIDQSTHSSTRKTKTLCYRQNSKMSPKISAPGVHVLYNTSPSPVVSKQDLGI